MREGFSSNLGPSWPKSNPEGKTCFVTWSGPSTHPFKSQSRVSTLLRNKTAKTMSSKTINGEKVLKRNREVGGKYLFSSWHNAHNFFPAILYNNFNTMCTTFFRHNCTIIAAQCAQMLFSRHIGNNCSTMHNYTIVKQIGNLSDHTTLVKRFVVLLMAKLQFQS